MSPTPADHDRDIVAYLSGDDDARIADGAERGDLDDLRAVLADPDLWAEPPASLEDSIVMAISAERGRIDVRPDAVVPGPGTAPAPASAGSAPASADPADELAAARQRRSGRSRLLRPAPLLAAAAAVAVIAASAIFYFVQSSGPRYDVALTATEAAPGASGSATLVRTQSGWEIKLDATGLPRLDNGRFYQAWLRNPAGVLVPIGTFNEGADVILWSGVSPAEYSTFTVTIEEADGNQASSGKRVLTGTAVPD